MLFRSGWDGTQWGVEGRILPDQERLSWFDRLPKSAQQSVTKSVWSLSRDSAGMLVRFQTDASSIQVHYKLTKSTLGMPHMAATGVTGIDLYARDGEGKWKWVQVAKPNAQEVKVEIIKGLAPGLREYAAYLPLYNGVEFVQIDCLLVVRARQRPNRSRRRDRNTIDGGEQRPFAVIAVEPTELRHGGGVTLFVGTRMNAIPVPLDEFPRQAKAVSQSREAMQSGQGLDQPRGDPEIL